MRIVFQRVCFARVTVDGAVVGEIGVGALLLCGVGDGDTPEDAALCAAKTAGLRVFEDEDDRMNLSLLDIGGEALVVSNFTLYGDCRKGRRPNFSASADPVTAKERYEAFAQALRDQGVSRVETGRFGADMQIEMQADGPVTIWIDSEALRAPRRGGAAT
ncbi:MAG: D-tyrosyl-tRNA(Tyr) deacylase [Clostridia bacterium]|nr:D-tyrosyl-tRNA(Tyr) deacylase [Clostridia bacterium]